MSDPKQKGYYIAGAPASGSEGDGARAPSAGRWQCAGGRFRGPSAACPAAFYRFKAGAQQGAVLSARTSEEGTTSLPLRGCIGLSA